MGKDEAKFAGHGVEILGVSRDDLDSHARFAAKVGANFPLLSDRDGAVGKAYGAAMPLVPVHARKAFLIDQEGRIAGIFEGMPDHQAILEAAGG